MKITICDLLKLINDDKAPQKIKFRGEIYIWNNIDYLATNKLKNLFNYYDIITIFNEEVEIIEEDKKIEKLNIPCNFICSTNGMAKEDLEHLDFNFKEIENKLNELIEEIEKLKESK